MCHLFLFRFFVSPTRGWENRLIKIRSVSECLQWVSFGKTPAWYSRYNISLTNLKAGIFSSAQAPCKARNPKNKDIHTSTAWLDCGICHSKSKLHIQKHLINIDYRTNLICRRSQTFLCHAVENGRGVLTMQGWLEEVKMWCDNDISHFLCLVSTISYFHSLFLPFLFQFFLFVFVKFPFSYFEEVKMWCDIDISDSDSLSGPRLSRHNGPGQKGVQ